MVDDVNYIYIFYPEGSTIWEIEIQEEDREMGSIEDILDKYDFDIDYCQYMITKYRVKKITNVNY